ncbi:MAG: inositol monophosphatase family protein [Flavobacteriales bacterium]
MQVHEIDLSSVTRSIVRMSREIGDWMKSQRGIHESMAEVKSENNLVTFVDKESERRFVAGLASLIPQAGFVAEEGTGERNPSGLNWVIDPLDGTTNYVHGVPVWCTSVALCVNDIPVCGVIYDPNSNEMFSAFQGGGAFLNDVPMRVSSIETLSAALLATGFPYDDWGREASYIGLFRQLMKASRGMRRLGSAALDMAWVAAGRFEGFYEYGLNPWDVAAGTVIIREAGGEVTGFHAGGDPVFGDDLNCTNGLIHDELSSIIQAHFLP